MAENYINRMSLDSAPKRLTGANKQEQMAPKIMIQEPEGRSKKASHSSSPSSSQMMVPKSPSINFMHDPCTLAEPSQSSSFTIERTSLLLPSSSSTAATLEAEASATANKINDDNEERNHLGAPEQSQRQRKASLMPPLTEEDLRTTGMGHRDPESVAQLFGQDFASRFCLGPLLLPHEIRDCSVPHGIPIVKMRRRLGTQSSLESPTAESVVPLTPVAPKFPSSPGPSIGHNHQPHHMNKMALAQSPSAPLQWLPGSSTIIASSTYFNSHSHQIPGVVHNPPIPFPVQFQWNEDGSIKMVPFKRPAGDFYTDMAASHPDLLQFQLALNDWIRRQCQISGSALLLTSADQNITFCHVCGGQLLDQPIHCGDADFLSLLLRTGAERGRKIGQQKGEQQPQQQQKSSRDNEGRQGTNVLGEEDPKEGESIVVIRVEQLEESLRTSLNPLLTLLWPQEDGAKASNCFFSLVGLRSNSGFNAGLLLAHQSEQNRIRQMEQLAPHLGMLGTLMTLMHNIEEQRRLAQQSQVFLSMTQNVFSSLQDMNQLVRNITKEAKALVQAEICSLFLLDKEHAELVAEVFEKNGTSEEYLTEIRMPLSQGIVGHVASTGQMMNVKDVYNHPYFYSKVDERTGFITRNILCFPIKDSSGNLVGVAELCNKIGRDAFSRHDEQIAATFAVYCAISLSHCLLYRKLQEAHRRSHMAAELLVQGSTLSIAPEDILRLTVRDIPPPHSFHPQFDKLHFIPRSIGSGDIYVEASLAMFKDLGFIDRFRLRRRTLARFLLMVQKGYRDVPYHNWGHAFAVAHFCFLLLRMPTVRAALNDLERFGLLVACLCHDIDHRGTTNAFQLQSQTPLAQLYSSEGSVLERHHFAQTVTILGMDECNIFEQLTRQQYVNVLDCIREVILATDIAAHLRKVDRIKEMVEGGFELDNGEHHYLFMCLLMTASDLSDQSKDFRHSKAIAENIYKEFFSQGDLEKQMGNRPIEMMDRDRACVPKIQIEFMDTVALPVFMYLGDLLPEVRSTHKALLANRRCWLALDQILQEQGLPRGGLDYLRDNCLEDNVLQRVAPKEEEEESEDGAKRGRTEAEPVPMMDGSGSGR